MDILLVRHRVNSVTDCAALPRHIGAEIDLRSFAPQGKEIILNHEPFEGGDRFVDFLKAFGGDHQAPLILNPKEDGLETLAMEECARAGVKNYFFLDLPVPTMVRLARQGFTQLALRVSEYEPFEMAVAFKGMAQWAWLDCFQGNPANQTVIEALQGTGYRICVVSPELQKYPKEKVLEHRAVKKWLRPGIDAVCTKYPEIWRG